MKQTFTTLLMSLLVVGSASALAPKQAQLQVPEGAKMAKEIMAPGMQVQSFRSETQGLKVTLPTQMSRDIDIISETPEGTLKYYNVYASGIMNFWGLIAYPYQQEFISRIVWDGSDVYINSINPAEAGLAWVKGSLSEDGTKITVDFPQNVAIMVGYDENGDELEVPLQVGLVESYTYEVQETDENGDPLFDEEGNPVMIEYSTYIPVEEGVTNQATYTIAADGTIFLDGGHEWDTDEEGYIASYPDTMYGLYYEYAGETVWYNSGCFNQEYTVIEDDEVTVAPEGLVWKDVQMNDAMGNAKNIKIAKDGDTVYFTNLWAELPDAVVAGMIDGDKIVIPSKQFLGYNEDYGYAFWFMGGEYVSDTEMYVADEFVFNIENGLSILGEIEKLTSAENALFICNAALDRVYYLNLQLSPYIFQPTAEDMNCAPADPMCIAYADYQDYYGQDMFEWLFPATTVRGAFLNTDNAWYNAYINGELFTFYVDDFPHLGVEEITDMPYNFSDEANYDIFASGTIHTFYIPGEGILSMGIQIHYLAPDGEVYSSNLVTYDVETGETTGVKEISNVGVKEVKNVSFTNLQGIEVANPTPGQIYIQSTTFTDGSRSVSKVIIK